MKFRTVGTMYRFESSTAPKELEKRYKAIYARAGIQRKWDKEKRSCPELGLTLPLGVKPVDLLTMKYEKLVEVYLQYKRVQNGLSDVRKNALNTAAARIYSYQSYVSKIKDFFLLDDNGFEIHNCVYCDLKDVRTYKRRKNQFDTEHILDKGECPLVGLSLYNFCPSCTTCNRTCKGTNPIGKGDRQMKKVSPTSKQYDFKNKVKFILTPNPEEIGSIKFDHPEWYEVDFDYKDDDYKAVTDLFDLKERYNEPQNKQQALEWRSMAMKYRGISLKLGAWLHFKTEAQYKEEIFHLEAHRKVHSLMLKLQEDMMFDV